MYYTSFIRRLSACSLLLLLAFLPGFMGNSLYAQVPCNIAGQTQNGFYDLNGGPVGQVFTPLDSYSCIDVGDNLFESITINYGGNSSPNLKVEIFNGLSVNSVDLRYSVDLLNVGAGNAGTDITLSLSGGTGDPTFTMGQTYTFVITRTSGNSSTPVKYVSDAIPGMAYHNGAFKPLEDLLFSVETGTLPCNTLSGPFSSSYSISSGVTLGQSFVATSECITAGHNVFDDIKIRTSGNGSGNLVVRIYDGQSDNAADLRYTSPSYSLSPGNAGTIQTIPLAGGTGDQTFVLGNTYSFLIEMPSGGGVLMTTTDDAILGAAYDGSSFDNTKDLIFDVITSQGPATSTGTGNWNNPATWSSGSVPTATDEVVIAAGHTVTVNLFNPQYADLTVDAGGTLAFDFGGTIIIPEDIQNNGTIDLLNGLVTGNGTDRTITNATGATIDHHSCTFDAGGTIDLINQGQYIKIGNNNDPKDFPGSFTNNGTVQVNATKELGFSGDFINNGVVSLLSNGKLNFSGTNISVNTGSSLTGTGGAYLEFGGNVIVNGNTDFVLNVSNINHGTASMIGSGIGMEISSGNTYTMNNGGIDGFTSLTNNGTMNLGDVNTKFITTDVTNNGTFALSTGVLTTSGPPATFTNAATGILSYTGGSINSIDIVNQGTVNLASNVGFTTSFDNQSGATVNMAGGQTNSFGGNFINNGDVAGTGTFTLNSPATLSGSGSFTGASGSVNTNLGTTLSPGNSPGCLTFANNYNLSGTFTVEVNGTTPCTGFDQITVGNTLTLGANAELNVTVGGGYTPANGDVITIIDANTLAGSTEFLIETTPPDWDVVYNSPNAGEVSLVYNLAAPALELVVGEETSGPNNTVTIPISVNNFTGINNFQGTITYDPAILTFQSWNAPNATVETTIGAPNGGSIPAGKATFGWADLAGVGQTLTDGTVVAELTFTVAGSAPEGQSDINIDGSLTQLGYAVDPDATSFLTPTLDQGFVYVDATAPTALTTDLFSNNANTAFAKVGDVVTLNFTTSEALGATPSVTFTTGNGAQTATVSGSGTSWTATYTVASGDDGVVAYVITMEDIYANSTTTASATTDDDGDDVTIDTIDPVITCPFTGIQEFNNTPAQCDGVVSWAAATATDANLVGSPAQQSGPTTGATLNVDDQQTVVYTVSDEAGNTATCSFDVVVRDVEAPVLTVPGAVTNVNNDAGVCQASVNLDALTAATDNCTANPTITYTLGGSAITSPHVFPVGSHTVTATAVDAAGLTDVETFDITVADDEDPVLTVPAAPTAVNNTTGVCEASVDLDALTSATDNCTGSPAITYAVGGSAITSPNTFAVGTYTVTATATDGAGNTDVQSFVVEVVDNEDPVLTVPGATTTVNNEAGVCQASVDLDALTSATDNCPNPAITYTENGSAITSPHVFPVGSYTVTATATDGAGNTDVETFTIEVVDNEDPVFGTINPITVQLGTGGTVTVTGADFAAVLTGSSDNCAVASLTVGALNTQTFDCNTLGAQTVSLILTDIYGNTATASATVNVENNPTVDISGIARTEGGNAINGTSFDLAGDQGPQVQQAGGSNAYTFTLAPCSSNDIGASFASPSVTDLAVNDVVAIIRHTLFIQDLGTPYKRIAADVNNTDDINVLDAFQVARRILTIIPDFDDPNTGTPATVAFVPSGYVFPDANNPWTFDTRISYTNPAPATGQDFIGIKLGDANGDWLGAARNSAPVDSTYLLMDDLVAQPGQLITIPVRVKDFADIAGYQFTMNWDQSVLELEEVRDGALQAMYNTDHAGKLASVWADFAGQAISLQDEDVAFELVFRATSAWGAATELTLSSEITERKAYNGQDEPISVLAEPVTISVGSATSVDPMLKGYAFTQAVPNPFDRATELVFSLGQPETVEIEIFNALGQSIRSFRAPFGAGEHTWTWNGQSQNGQEVATGVYHLRMRAGAFVSSMQVQKRN